MIQQTTLAACVKIESYLSPLVRTGVYFHFTAARLRGHAGKGEGCKSITRHGDKVIYKNNRRRRERAVSDFRALKYPLATLCVRVRAVI